MSPMPNSSTHTKDPQGDLFPGERKLGPVLEVLADELDPAGFAALKRYGQRLERLMQGQREKSEIRQEYYRLRAELGPKEAQQRIMDAYDLGYDLFDKIIYPRIGT